MFGKRPLPQLLSQPQTSGSWAPLLTFLYDWRYKILNRSDSLPGHSLLSNGRQREPELSVDAETCGCP